MSLYINPVLSQLFDGGAGLNAFVAQALEGGEDIGEGEMSAAMGQLGFPLGIVFPKLFNQVSHVYGHKASTIVSVSATLLNALVVVPNF